MSTRTAPASAPYTAVGAIAPIDSDERLHTLDNQRGFALAGMILVHFHQRLEHPVTGAEDLIGWGVWIFAEQKAWGTFAFLFGVGFAVLLRRLEARGTRVVPIYARRLVALAVFGIITTVGLGFSILFEYACWGFVLLLVRRWPTRRLLVLALVAACARPIVAEAGALYAWWTHAAASPSGPGLWALGQDADKLPHYSSVLAVRWSMFVAGLPHRWRDLLPASNLTLFILGLLAVRHGVLEEPRAHRRLIVGWMTFGALSWAISWTVLRALPEVRIAGAGWPLEVGLGLLQDQWLALTYIGGVVLLLAYRPQWTGRLRLFGEAGRMGLTNYLLQALVFDVLGSGYGFGVRIRPYAFVLAAPAMFITLALLSRAWLGRYRYGPAEWLWRSVTYARRQPLRRGSPRTGGLASLA
ncbi:MAG TPA: DUF418 domain-containing protein [Gemmatimonadaceae bacterium]